MKKEDVGNIIQKRREFFSLKQEDLAEMTGIASKTIYLIEKGKGNPSFETLQKILQILGMDIFIDIKKTGE